MVNYDQCDICHEKIASEESAIEIRDGHLDGEDFNTESSYLVHTHCFNKSVIFLLGRGDVFSAAKRAMAGPVHACSEAWVKETHPELWSQIDTSFKKIHDAMNKHLSGMIADPLDPTAMATIIARHVSYEPYLDSM
jgi:hypothetical protein